MFYVVGIFGIMLALNWEAGTLDYVNCAGSGASYKLFPEAYLKMEQAGQKRKNSMITGAYNEGITGAQTSKALVIEEKKQPSFQGTY